ncbi:hypothetical protein BH10PSE1_BH10PSE1_01580 [soil metagenome]
MLRTRLLTATAAIALFAAPAAFAQTSTTAAPAQPQATPTTTNAAPMAPAMPEAMTPPAPQSTVPSVPEAAPAPAEAAAPAPTQTAEAATPAATGNVIDTLKADGHFTTLLAALDSAQLTDTLKSQPAISIFAPTDAAFAKLPEAERTRLMDPANVNDLRQLLLYHVIVADVNSSQIEGTKGGVETAARTQVQLDGTGDTIKVDAATVTTADIDASNGSIFAIDTVLSPGASAVASGDADEDAAPAGAAAPTETAPAPTPPAADESTPPPADETDMNAPVATPPAPSPAPTPPVESDTDAAPNPTPAPAPAPVPTPQS